MSNPINNAKQRTLNMNFLGNLLPSVYSLGCPSFCLPSCRLFSFQPPLVEGHE